MVQLPHQHGKNPSYVLEDMPKDGDFSAVSEIFHSVSDPKRLKLFWLLCHYEECVINLSALMGMSSPALSHHLKVLKAQGLIKSRRVGKEMYYTAADGEASRLLHHMIEMLEKRNSPLPDHPGVGCFLNWENEKTARIFPFPTAFKRWPGL